MTATDVVNRYTDAFHSGDMETAASLLSEDFQFHGPLMQAESRADFFEKMAGFNLVAESVVHRMIEHGTTVARVFDFVISEPVSTTVPMAEWMEVENGRITKAWLYYDSAAFPTG